MSIREQAPAITQKIVAARCLELKPFVPYSISATFYDEKDGSAKTVQVPIGQSLMEAAHANDIDLEGKYCASST